MSRTLTLILLSGSTENEDAKFAVNLTKAVLKHGDKVNIFLYGNGCNLANKDVPYDGRSPISDALREHMDSFVLSQAIEEIASMGANVVTCHTTEYSRGTEGCAYLRGVEWGDVGNSLTRFVMATDVLLTIGH